MPPPSTEPTPRARELVRGAYDLHVHVEPDLAKRRIDDLSLARRFAEVGLAGFVLKSHYVPTAERAAVVRAAPCRASTRSVAIALNAGVGGLNAQAVEIAARGGARIVWLPTVDSENEASEDGPKPAKQPVWRRMQDEFVAAGVAERAGTGHRGRRSRPCSPSSHAISWSSRPGISVGPRSPPSVERRSARRASTHVLVTHPDYPTQGVPIAEQVELADRGAILERCFAPIHSGKVSWEETFAAIRATGPARNVLSTDLGQIANPPVEDGLAADGRRAARGRVLGRRDPYDGGREHAEARRCLGASSSSARIPRTSSGAPPARSRRSSPPAGRRRSSRSRTASAASRASSGRRRGRRRSGSSRSATPRPRPPRPRSAPAFAPSISATIRSCWTRPRSTGSPT